MTQPSIPTVLSLVTEGLRQARIFNPTQTQLNLYQNEVMEQLKNDLWQEVKNMKPLMTFSYTMLVPGQSRYSCPADFSSDLSMVCLTGLVTGQAIAGSMNTLIIPASVGPLSSDQTMGKDIIITAGSAFASCSQIIDVTANSDGSQTLMVYPNFQTIPDASSFFMIIDNQWPIDAKPISQFDDKYRPAYLDRPRFFFPMGDEDFDEFIFDCAPDATFQYAIRMRYYVNVMTLDLSSTLMSALYLKFRQYWIKGIKAQALSDNDDTTATAAFAERNKQLQDLIISQQYGTDIHALQQRVEDY